MFEKALPKIPALSNAETATHVCFFLEETMFGKNKLELATPAARPVVNVFFNIQFNIIGHIEDLPTSIQKLIQYSIDETKNNTGMILTLALSYGGRQEILDVVKKVAQMVKDGKISTEEINFPLIESFLSTHPMPDPDLLIRTSGERRISNFLLYQSAYTELHYNNVLWPDFTEDDFLNAIIDYQGRDRRFGMTQEQIAKA